MEKDGYNLYLKAAKYYDYDNRDNLTEDIPFYLEYAGKTRGEILELGCGTGRVAIPLAQAGCNVTGLDLSNSMLEVFYEKLRKLPIDARHRIELLNRDISSFKFTKYFDLVIAPFRVFQALTEENKIRNCLECVREHLHEDGLFIINAFRPYKFLDESWCYPETVQWETMDKDSGRKIAKKHRGRMIDVERQIIYVDFVYEISSEIGAFERIEEKLSLKYYYSQQMKELLNNSRFKVIEEYGWYDKSDIENGRELIFVCRRMG